LAWQKLKLDKRNGDHFPSLRYGEHNSVDPPVVRYEQIPDRSDPLTMLIKDRRSDQGRGAPVILYSLE
jgi:hypothetical protein